MTQILLFAGSNRGESLNRKLMYACAAVLEQHCTIDVLAPSEADLPIFNQDLEGDLAIMTRVATLYSRFNAADGFVFISPEYNASVAPLFKNLIDWVSRLPYIDSTFPNAFLHRPVLLGSAVGGWSGGAFGINHARAILTYLGAIPLAEQLSLPHANQLWDGEKPNFSPDLKEYMISSLIRLVSFAQHARS